MPVLLAHTDAEIRACYPVMRELRPHLVEGDFPAQVRRQQDKGYRLVYLESGQQIVAVAGFRLGENLAWGRFLYIDDLVSLPAQRSQGHGAKLLDWLRAYAIKEGCAQLHLDSGIQRKAAHRFYLREGMVKASYHFCENLPRQPL